MAFFFLQNESIPAWIQQLGILPKPALQIFIDKKDGDDGKGKSPTVESRPVYTMFSLNDQKWMREALFEAKKGFTKNEVPVGAVIVASNRVIARAHNCVEAMCDPTAHAELVALRRAAQKQEDWRLTEMTLYTTLEPCPMCAGAALLARIKKIVWAAADLRQGADGSWICLLGKKHPIHHIEVACGLFAAEAGKLMTEFFRKRRKTRNNDKEKNEIFT